MPNENLRYDLNENPRIFYVFNNKGKFFHWNKNFEEVTGYSNAEISMMSPLKFFAEEILKNTLQELEGSNHELEQFAYVASHDLQENNPAPRR